MTDFIPPKENPPCNLKTCKYNAFGECTNDGKRKECVEVSKRVLCLEDTEEHQNPQNLSKEIAYRYAVLSDSERCEIVEKFPDVDFSEESLVKLLEQLEEKDVKEEFLQALKNFD